MNLDDLNAAARACLDPAIYDYIAGGAGEERTLLRNRTAWREFVLLPRMLRGVGDRSLETFVLGTRVRFPVLVAPMAFHGICHADAEGATGRAVAASGSIFVASVLSNLSIEAIVDAMGVGGHCWFQLYIHRDRALSRTLVERAEAAGCTALCLTVDAPVAGNRERDRRNRFRLPAHLSLGNLPAEHSTLHRTAAHGSSLAGYISTQFDPSLTWADVEWLRSITSLPLLVKGVLRPDDARLAVDHGVAGIIVSNHGGRQLDGAPAAISVLESIVDAVAGRAEILLDGGIRHGTDILAALALGARAVLVGRPALWALATGGSDGVRNMLDQLYDELDLAMALAGCCTPADVGRDLVRPSYQPSSPTRPLA